MLTVINLNISNLSSVLNALDYLGLKYQVSNDKEEIRNASALLLPGVGTFAAGMDALRKHDLVDTIREEVLENKKPLLGICLGMQMFFETSDESPGAKGLCLFEGKVERLPSSEDYTIPRIGWGESRAKKDFFNLKKDDIADFYYIHSFYANPKDKAIVAITSEKNDVTGAVQKDNIYGCQFHPEKSHIAGLAILKEFARLAK